eukprot:1135477-Pleurochrysis_carterae.AAC.1
MADALLRCERAIARLRAALSVPASDPNHDYLRSWVDRVGACDFDDLVRDDALLDSPASERASPALALHPFTLLFVPPRYGALPTTWVAIRGVLLSDLRLPVGAPYPPWLQGLAAWLDTRLDDLTTR